MTHPNLTTNSLHFAHVLRDEKIQSHFSCVAVYSTGAGYICLIGYLEPHKFIEPDQAFWDTLNVHLVRMVVSPHADPAMVAKFEVVTQVGLVSIGALRSLLGLSTEQIETYYRYPSKLNDTIRYQTPRPELCETIENFADLMVRYGLGRLAFQSEKGSVRVMQVHPLVPGAPWSLSDEERMIRALRPMMDRRVLMEDHSRYLFMNLNLFTDSRLELGHAGTTYTFPTYAMKGKVVKG